MLHNSIDKKISSFQKKVTNLRSKGYEPLVRNISISDDSYESQIKSMYVGSNEIVAGDSGKHFRNGGMRKGGLMSNDATMLDYSQNVSIPVEGCGKEGLGYIPWGKYNDLPVMIYRASAALPYTAQALQYLSDTVVGLGPRLMYHIARYSGGTVTNELIPYEDAGVWLRQRIRELTDKLAYIEPNQQPALFMSYTEELIEVKQELELWKSTLPEVEAFESENNLDQHFQRCMAEDVRLDIYFPTVELEKGKSGSWAPKITRVGYIDASTARFEEKDENWKINNVYYSELWREDLGNASSAAMKDDDVVAYPVASPEKNLEEIKEYVLSNQRTKVGARKLHWCCPQFNPTPTKPYYPQPAWWSIFPSQVFQYASTLIYDKAIARKNSTMWKKILFINTSFLDKVFQQMGIEGDEEAQMAYRNKIYDTVENALSNRENNGKLLVMDSYMSADEKQLIDSIKIVDVPTSNEKDSDSALQIATSAVFFALGVHPALVGAEPGKIGNSGTFQRELHLLKVTQLSSRQRRYLSFLNSIVRFNKWPKNARYVIKQANLSTLDASKTGIIERAEE